MKAAANWRQELIGQPSRPYALPSPEDEFQREGSWPSSGPGYITEHRGEPTGLLLHLGPNAFVRTRSDCRLVSESFFFFSSSFFSDKIHMHPPVNLTLFC